MEGNQIKPGRAEKKGGPDTSGSSDNAGQGREDRMLVGSQIRPDRAGHW